ncbi:RsmB/NOP family class I SAM-dependent RNA methyltransferase [Roseovarius salinarum]|uniref:RsmB/NOP family class I SAM-dependent RNA methyltransferase n=1 Tax=Roseovarius salinarum TaxID=1981892 RepID=UPI000C33811E|nr:transcription antitermination factor NusB [Roseovarius salinarum]
MKNAAPSARAAAVGLLDKVLGERRLMADLVASGALASLEPADRARAQRLALDALRGLDRADRVLKPHLRKPPPMHVRNLLRLATVELCTGGDAHGVVHDAVTLAAAHRKHRALKGLVNAVLRKVARDGPGAWNDLPVPRLPAWLRKRLIGAYGSDAVAAMERAHFARAPLDLTARTDAAAVARQVGGTLLPTGSVRLDRGAQLSVLPGYAEGDWWVQDAAAALPARVLGARPGERVLDLCAAPGGKTMQLAAAGAAVTALDNSADRMERLAENLARTGLEAECITGDALAHAGGPYDGVLLDAPCSATGTIRRHPELPHVRDGREIGALAKTQAAMLDHALALVKPGGRLVFCTCSLLPEEGERQIAAALQRHPRLQVDAAAGDLPGVDPQWRTADGGLRLRPDFWPELGGMDGFFIACLRP